MFVVGLVLLSAVVTEAFVPGLLHRALDSLHLRVTLRCRLWFVCSIPQAVCFMLEEKHLISEFFQEIIPDVESSLRRPA